MIFSKTKTAAWLCFHDFQKQVEFYFADLETFVQVLTASFLSIILNGMFAGIRTTGCPTWLPVKPNGIVFPGFRRRMSSNWDGKRGFRPCCKICSQFIQVVCDSPGYEMILASYFQELNDACSRFLTDGAWYDAFVLQTLFRLPTVTASCRGRFFRLVKLQTHCKIWDYFIHFSICFYLTIFPFTQASISNLVHSEPKDNQRICNFFIILRSKQNRFAFSFMISIIGR